MCKQHTFILGDYDQRKQAEPVKRHKELILAGAAILMYPIFTAKTGLCRYVAFWQGFRVGLARGLTRHAEEQD